MSVLVSKRSVHPSHLSCKRHSCPQVGAIVLELFIMPQIFLNHRTHRGHRLGYTGELLGSKLLLRVLGADETRGLVAFC